MKFIACLLSVMVITLTIAPCCAWEKPDTAVQHVTDKPDGSERDDDCCKDCSPFYVCGTCIGFTFATQQPDAFTIPVKPVKHNTAYVPVSLPLIPFSIWQPPKVS